MPACGLKRLNTQSVNFPTQISNCDLHSLSFQIYVNFMAVVFVLQWLFFHGKIGIVLLSQFLLTFLQTQTRGGAPLHSTAFYFSPADWEGIYDSLRYVLWEDIFQLVACTVASKMCWWVQVGIAINIRSSVHGFHLHGFWMLVLLLLLIEISCLIFCQAE